MPTRSHFLGSLKEGYKASLLAGTCTDPCQQTELGTCLCFSKQTNPLPQSRSTPAALRGVAGLTHLHIRPGGSAALDEALYDTVSRGPRAREQLVSLHSLQEGFQRSDNLGEGGGKSVPASVGRQRAAEKGRGAHSPC